MAIGLFMKTMSSFKCHENIDIMLYKSERVSRLLVQFLRRSSKGNTNFATSRFAVKNTR